MDTNQTKIVAGGLYVHGVVVSSSAKSFQRKDGSGLVVKVQHEIATSPGVVLIEQYMDPKESKEVKLEGDKVVAFPEMRQFSSVTLKVTRYRFHQDRLVITAAEKMDPPESAMG